MAPVRAVWRVLGAFLLAVVAIAPTGGLAQSSLPRAERPSELEGVAPADAIECEGLQKLASLAVSKERFASIIGKPRDGNFLETTLHLAGWTDCSLYGTRTYTCDSPSAASAEKVERELANVTRRVEACLGAAWSEDADRSSRSYIVLRHVSGAASMTFSTDEKEKQEYVIHLILFVR